MRSAQSSDRSIAVKVAPHRRQVVVHLAGDLDIASVDGLEREVQRQSRTAGIEQIVIDLREVTFMDASGLGALVSLRNAAKRQGQTFILVPGPPNVQRVFDITAMRAVFDWQLRVVDGSASVRPDADAR
jgi:anti-anti-sigma factor